MQALKVVLSKPMTARFPLESVEGWEQVADESAVTWRWGQKFQPPFGDMLTQSEVVWRLLRCRHRADVIVAGRYADVLAAIQALLPFGKRPLLLLDSEWMLTPRSAVRAFVTRTMRRITARGATRIQVFCEAEADQYSAHYGISREKFVWIPYCPPDSELNLEVCEGEYIFSGGFHERDWVTFAEAVKDLQQEIRIAAPLERIPKGLRSPNMVFLGRVSREEYFRQLAGCKMLVLSVAPVVRYPGVITYAYAMRLGKCVVVNERHGARSYIQDGVNGRLVENADPHALRVAIKELLDDHVLRRRLADGARTMAERHLTPAAYWRRVDDITKEIVEQSRKPNDTKPVDGKEPVE